MEAHREGQGATARRGRWRSASCRSPLHCTLLLLLEPPVAVDVEAAAQQSAAPAVLVVLLRHQEARAQDAARSLAGAARLQGAVVLRAGVAVGVCVSA